MSSIYLARTRWLLLTAVVPLLTSCAAGVSRLHPLIREEAETTRLAQVTVLVPRQHIIVQGRYDDLIASGIAEADLGDRSVAEGRVYCCGGPNLNIWFYVPTGMEVNVGDIVEVKLGRQPEGGSRGMVNIATRVPHRRADAEYHCRWDPPNERLWMRTLYCDWMEKEGWVQKEYWGHKTWLKPTPTMGTQ